MIERTSSNINDTGEITLKLQELTTNILSVLCTALGRVAFATVIWLCIMQPKTKSYLKLVIIQIKKVIKRTSSNNNDTGVIQGLLKIWTGHSH